MESPICIAGATDIWLKNYKWSWIEIKMSLTLLGNERSGAVLYDFGRVLRRAPSVKEIVSAFRDNIQ